MNTGRKVTLLYKKAHGQRIDVSSAEAKELKKYKVDANEGSLATRKNIADYVKAVDRGTTRTSFYDWCYNHKRADRRYKGNSAKEMASSDREGVIAIIFLGWLTWGMAIYWMFHGTMPVKTCAIAGMVVSAILYKISRRWIAFTGFLLPIILLAVAFGR